MTDPTKTLFEEGVAFLTSRGIIERKARSNIGKWRKEHSDEEVLRVLRIAIKRDITEPVSYITAALRGPKDSDLFTSLVNDATR